MWESRVPLLRTYHTHTPPQRRVRCDRGGVSGVGQGGRRGGGWGPQGPSGTSVHSRGGRRDEGELRIESPSDVGCWTVSGPERVRVSDQEVPGGPGQESSRCRGVDGDMKLCTGQEDERQTYLSEGSFLDLTAGDEGKGFRRGKGTQEGRTRDSDIGTTPEPGGGTGPTVGESNRGEGSRRRKPGRR